MGMNSSISETRVWPTEYAAKEASTQSHAFGWFTLRTPPALACSADCSTFMNLCLDVLQSHAVSAYLGILTLALLYCEDIIESVAEAPYDKVYEAFLWVCLVCFSVEFVFNLISSKIQKPSYNFSLFFFLDLLAILSIWIDIMANLANAFANKGVLARAARSARIGSRLGRSLRLIQLARNMRLLMLTRVLPYRRRSSLSWQDRTMSDDSMDLARADSIGSRIAETTTKKVITMSLIILVSYPVLARDKSLQQCNSEIVVFFTTLYTLPHIGGNCTEFVKEVEPWFGESSAFIDYSTDAFTGFSTNGLIYARIERCEIHRDSEFFAENDLELKVLSIRRRISEIHTIPCGAKIYDDSYDGVDDRSESYFLYDMRRESIVNAHFAMGFTTMMLAIFVGFSMVFASEAESIANELVKPIQQLMKDMRHTSRLELDKVTPINNVVKSDMYEVKKLQICFHRLHAAVGSFSKFTPLEVVRHFLQFGNVAELGVVPRSVSMLFSDIVDFAAICESTPLTEVINILSDYFEDMVSLIREERGTMLEFIGDGILAIWNAPGNVVDHAERAITSALRMKILLAERQLSWSLQGRPRIDIRCGLHSADVLVGNIGSHMRMKYGVLGDGVNLTSRVEELNKRYRTDVLISENMLQMGDVWCRFTVRPVDLVVVKGRVKPTKIYEILGFKHEVDEVTLEISLLASQAMSSYLIQDFSGALQKLDKIHELKAGNDPAGAVLTDRCKRFLLHPPGADWDGSDILNEKHF